MKQFPTLHSFLPAGAAALALALSSCASTSEKDNLQEVDNLISRIEQVNVEAERSRECIRDAVEALQVLAAPTFVGDSLEAYGAFVSAVERSEDQASSFDDAVSPMKRTAANVFERWESDIEEFSTASLQKRSADRLEETRGRFEEVTVTVDSAAAAYDAFNEYLRDHVKFLEHDLNRSAVEAIRDEVAALAKQAKTLDGDFTSCSHATLSYVRSTNLHGRVTVAQAAPAN